MTGSAFSRTSRRGRGGGCVDSRERRHAWLHGWKVHHDIECVPRARREKSQNTIARAGPVLTRDSTSRRVRARSERGLCRGSRAYRTKVCGVQRACREGSALSVGESEDWTDTESRRGAEAGAERCACACASSSTRTRLEAASSPRARRPFRAPRELAHPASSARSSIM